MGSGIRAADAPIAFSGLAQALHKGALLGRGAEKKKDEGESAMRSTVVMLAAAAILLAGAPAALAKGATQQFSGQISRIDTVAKTLAVKEQGKAKMEMTFAIPSSAKIMAGSKVKSLGELKVGEDIKVSYADVGSKHEAQRIELMRAKTTAVKPYQKPSAR